MYESTSKKEQKWTSSKLGDYIPTNAKVKAETSFTESLRQRNQILERENRELKKYIEETFKKLVGLNDG